MSSLYDNTVAGLTVRRDLALARASEYLFVYDPLLLDLPNPKGPKIETIQDPPLGLNILSEIEKIKASHPPNPNVFFGGGGEF